MLTIGTLSARTGAKVQTIRYYEGIGLMPKAERSAGGQRRYRQMDLDRLAFIRHGRQLGFGLEAIREMLTLADDPSQPCSDADFIAWRQLVQVEQRIERMQALRTELRRMIRECSGDNVARCRVLEILRDHSKCLTNHGDTGSSTA